MKRPTQDVNAGHSKYPKTASVGSDPEEDGQASVTVEGTRQASENPRHYQLELFKKACLGNVIAVLDTGAGKTLIALLLIKHVHYLQEQAFGASSGAGKKSIFFVPTVPLVAQQSAYLANHSELRVGQMWGGSNSSVLDQQKWNECIDRHDVIVMTPLILLNALDRGFVRLERFHLLVFDECHHARSSHPYNLIMKIHYHACPLDRRPKIFGMTASPCSGKESATVAVEQLEKSLHCSALSTKSSAQLLHYVSRPLEKIVYYSEGDFFDPPPLYIKILQCCPGLVPHLERELGDAMAFSDSLGPWAAERALELAIEDIVVQIQRKIKSLVRSQKHQEYLLEPDPNVLAAASDDSDDDSDVPVIPQDAALNRSFSSIDFGVDEKESDFLDSMLFRSRSGADPFSSSTIQELQGL
ncbi:Dicer-like protein 1, partial [Kappamyces sp. JEL0680]